MQVIVYNRMTLTILSDNLVVVQDENGRHYSTVETKDRTALDEAKALTSMFWGEVQAFGSAIYPGHNDGLLDTVIAAKDRQIEELQAQIDSMRANRGYF